MRARSWLAWAAVVWTTITSIPSLAANQAERSDTSPESSPATPAGQPLARPASEPASPLLDKAPGTGVRGWLDRLRAAPQKDASPEVVPTNLVYIRVSRRFLEQCMETAIEPETPVDDEILGTHLTGKATTLGSASLVLEPDETQAVFHITFSGTIQSETLGYNGPVVLHNDAVTKFLARKQVILSNDGLRGLPASVTAETTSTTGKIETRLTGLRGRIAQQVARRRSEELRPLADRIAAEHAAERIAAIFDGKVQAAAKQLEATLSGGCLKLPVDAREAPPLVRFRSAADHLEIIVHRPHPTAEALAIAPPSIEGNPEISVRVHRVVVRNVLTGGDLRTSLQGLLAGVLSGSPLKNGTGSEPVGNKSLENGGREVPVPIFQNAAKPSEAQVLTAAAPTPGAFDLRWSPDGDWLLLCYKRAGSRGVTPVDNTPLASTPPEPPIAVEAVANTPTGGP